MTSSPVFSTAAINQFRRDTPGSASLIHFNNAGASLPVQSVLDTVIGYLNEEAMGGGYETEDRYRDKIEAVYGSVARLINAGTDEIAMTENASAAWSIGFNGISFRPGDEVLTSEYEYVTNVLGFLHASELFGIVLRVIPNDADGNFSLRALQEAISPRTRLIAVTHIASATGGVLPINDIGQIARNNGILFLLDACQTVGQIPIDVKAIQCDILSATGRKFLRAPRGTGFLYVRKEVQDQLAVFIMDGHSNRRVNAGGYELRTDARRFELYERNRAVMLGLGTAVEYALHTGVERIWARIQWLAGIFRGKLNTLPGISVHDSGKLQCGIVTFSVEGMESADIKKRLQENGINTSVALRSSTIYFMEKHGLSSLVRASVHYYNTETEIDRFILVLGQIVQQGK